MLTSALNLAVIRTELDEVFYQNWSENQQFPGTATAETGAIFKPVPLDRGAYIGEIYKQVGLFDTIGETDVVPSDQPSVANKYTIYPLDFGKDIYLSKNFFDDNMHGVWAETIADMARKARYSQDHNAFKIFRNGFTTYTLPDSAAWFSSSHTLLGGGTETNLISGALSPSTLNDAIVKLTTMKEQSGVLNGGVPAVLLVPPALWKKAVEITESALIADVANNNINVYRSALGIEVWQSRWLSAAAGGSDTAWFVLSKTHAVRRLVRQGVQTALVSWEYSNNRSYKYTANFREEVFVTDYVGSVGSLGT
jgi:phage major head subunit gpT-like protein